jgi:hypothetical protein
VALVFASPGPAHEAERAGERHALPMLTVAARSWLGILDSCVNSTVTSKKLL